MKFFRNKQCFNTQFAYMSSVFSRFCSPTSADASLIEQQRPSKAPFQSPIQVNSTSTEQNAFIQENLIVVISLKNGCDF